MNQEILDHVQPLMQIHRHLHRLLNSRVSDPAIMNILAFNFKERLRNMLK